ncbi:MAG: hypothetical protein R3F14_04095 [Polyangiaceae bacterium]
MRQRILLPAIALLAAAGCNQVKDGYAPVLGDDVTVAEKERFARRLYLDLTGLPATAEETDTLIDRLDAEGNTAKTRAALASELIAAPAFGQLYLSETENAAFSGQSAAAAFTVQCQIVQFVEPSCQSCDTVDPCACACAPVKVLGDERDAFFALAADFVSGGATSSRDVERALAATSPFLFNGSSPEGITAQLFETFLARPAEADEAHNARFMIIGTFLPGSPAGLLFHRHASDYSGLLDIVFESEVYRDAIVARVFSRYLGRRPTGDELRFFSAELDPEQPDLRPLVEAVVSSSEYFRQ